MFTSSDPLPLDEKQQRSRPILTTACLSAGAVFAWVIPIVLIFVTGVPRGVFAVTAGLAITVTMASFCVGVLYWSRGARRTADREAAARYDNLLRLVTHHHMETQHAIAELAQLVRQELRQAKAEHSRNEWNRYAEGITDALGGPDVVDGTTTRSFSTNNVANVVPMARTHNGR